jgi:hypothetical protein
MSWKGQSVEAGLRRRAGDRRRDLRSYLRELLTLRPKEIWRRKEILVLLETIQRDPELFVPNLLQLLSEIEQEADH